MKKALALGAFALVVARPWLRNAGSTYEERRRAVTGDDLVPAAHGSSTMATTIEALPEAVWPWLVQMGCGRGGWYSWDRLDNAGVPSADRIHEEWQDLAVGDRLPSTPDGRHWFVVACLESERTLVLRSGVDLLRRESFDPLVERRRFFVDSTWAFALDRDGDRTRLIVRGRSETRPWLLGAAADLLFWEAAHLVMQRRQFRNLGRLAARHHDASEAPEELAAQI